MKFDSLEFILWYQSEATPEQKLMIKNIRSRRRFTRWAIARNHWWGMLKDSLIASLMILAVTELVCLLIYWLGKVIWWH